MKCSKQHFSSAWFLAIDQSDLRKTFAYKPPGIRQIAPAAKNI